MTSSSRGNAKKGLAFVEESHDDPTLVGSKRARGISSLALGSDFIFGLGCDSRYVSEYSA
jgi:hypothetical protein